METKVVGFFGQSCYLLPYLLARTVRLLDTKVCFVDLSEEGIARAITQDDSIENGMIATNRGVDYLECDSSGSTLDWNALEQYDYVFIYFGLQGITVQCEEVYFVTDGTPMLTADVMELSKTCGGFKTLLASSYANLSNRVAAIKNEAETSAEIDEVAEVALTPGDADAALSIVADSVPKLRSIGNAVVDFVQKFFEVDYTSKQITNAFRHVYKNK